MTDDTADDPEGEPAITPIEVAVVDVDLLWEVEVANALNAAEVYAERLGAVGAALARLPVGRGAVLVVGPSSLTDADADPLARTDHLLDVLARTRGLAVALVGDPGGGAGPPAGSDLAVRWRPLAGDTAVDDVVTHVLELLEAARLDAALAAPDAPAPGHPGAPVVLVTAAKGGEGATTVAVNLAHALREGDRPVALIEADPNFGDIAIALGLDAAPIVDDADGLHVPAARVAVATVTDDATGVQVLRPPRVADQLAAVPADTLDAFVDHAARIADAVVIDAPLATAVTTGLVDIADLVVLVTRPTVASTKNAVIALSALPRRRVVPVVNGRDRRVTLRRSPAPDTHQIATALGLDVADEIPEAGELDDRREPGRLALLAEPDGDAAAAFRSLARALRQRFPVTAMEPDPTT